MLAATNLRKTYRRNADQVKVLQGLSLDVHAGEFLSVVGASGSGKSTLLHLLGTLDVPDEGTITLNGRRIDNVTSRERDELRNTVFGYIFQFYHLLPEFNTLDNVLMPAYISNSLFKWFATRKEWRKRAEAMRLPRVLPPSGLTLPAAHRPFRLRGRGGRFRRCDRSRLCRYRRRCRCRLLWLRRGR